MAKVGAQATVKKKEKVPVQQAAPAPQPVGISMTAPTVTATVGPVQSYTPPASNGMAPVRATAGPVQAVSSTPEEIQATRAMALESLQQRALTKAQAAYDYKLNKLNKQGAQGNTEYRRQYADYRKEAEKASTKDLLNWLAQYKEYRANGSWDETQRLSLTTRLPVILSNYEKYGSEGAPTNYLKYKGFDSPASLAVTAAASGKTLEGPQLLKDVYGTEDYRKNPYDYFPNWQAKSDTLFNQGASLDTYGYDRNDFITPLEAQNYEWLYNNRGEKAAEEYRKSLNEKNDATYASWLENEFNPIYATEHPVAASVTSVFGTYGAPLAFLENTIATAKGEDINTNSWANALANQRAQLRNEVSKNISSAAGRFLYNTGMSVGDNLALMPLNALGGAGEAMMLGTLGASAANDRTRELMQQGASSQEAYMRGLVSGAIEGITEKIGLDNLLKGAWKGGAGNIVRSIAKQAAVEGAEEGIANVMNLAADTIASVVKQEGVGPLEKEIKELEKTGVTRSQATSQVILGHLKELGVDVAGGALAGAVMGGGAMTFSYASLVNQGRNMTTNEDGTINMEAVQSLIERGNNMPADTISHRQADLLQQKINEGKAVTPREAAVLYANNVSAESTMSYDDLLKLRKAEADPAEWQAAKDEAMGHAATLNKDVQKLYESAVDEAVTNGATGKQAIAEFDRAYTSGFNKMGTPVTEHLSQNTVQNIMQAAQTERKGSTATAPKVAASVSNAEQTLDHFNNYEENGAKVYQTAVREAVENGATPEEARVAFNQVYSNVRNNTPIARGTNIPLSASTVADIRNAALKDRFTAENKAKADAIPTSTNAGVSVSDPQIRQHIEQGRLTDTISFMDDMGKRFGVEISPVAKLPQNGQINLSTGHIDIALDTAFGGIINRDQAMRATLGHEISHRMRQASPKTWDKFTQAVIGADIDQFNADVNKMINETYKGDITRDAAQEEVIADYIGNRFFSGDIDTLRNMVESIDSLPQRSGFIQHIVDMASWIKSKLTGQPANNAARIETEFKKMFKETQARVQQAEEQRASEEEIKYSKKTTAEASDAEYMSAVKANDTEALERMVEEAARANGYVLSAYHGTGEDFTVFNRGSEGIHLGNEAQATQVAKSRYDMRSKETRYLWDDIRDDVDRMSETARKNLVARAWVLQDYFTDGNEVGPFNGDINNANAVREYVDSISERYKAASDTDKVYIRMETFDRPVGENVMHLYAKMSNPFTVNGDILEWTPQGIAELLLARNAGETSMKHWYNDGAVDISGSDIHLGKESRKALDAILNGKMKGDEAWETLSWVLQQNGYDGIQYLNQYEGDKNSYSYIALNPSDVKSANPVTYDANGNVIPLSERFNAENPDIRYSRRDSEGRTLTAEQAEYFAESKARDEDGNLLVLYHGTDAAGFNTFRGSVWMTTSRKDAGSYGAAARTYDPNEQRVDVSTKGGDFTIGNNLRFDTEQDRDEFLKNYPDAVNYMTPREMLAAKGAAELEDDYDRYDELVEQEKRDKQIRRAYRKYEDQHSEVITLKELIDNKEQYTVDDFKDAFLSIDREAYFDDEYDNFETDEEFRDALAEALEESFINGDEGYDDFPVRVRIPAGKTSTAADVTHIHNRIYEMYANVTHPYTYDAKGRGSEGNGAYYNAVQTAMDSDEYDGAIINNIRVGRYQELGTVVVAKDSSQTKLVSNATPTQNPDIRYSKRSNSSKTAVIRRQQETIDRLKHEMTLTHGVEPDPKAVAQAAVQFGRDWNSTLPETEIKDGFAEIAQEFARYRRLNNQGAAIELIRHSEQQFLDKCTELANKVVKSAAVLVGDNVRAQELKQFAWQHPIQIDPSFSKEFGDYRALQAAVKGKIKLAKDGMPISRLYESLSEQFSDYPMFQEFEGQTLEPAEMLTDLIDLFNDFDKAYNPYDTADAVDVITNEIMQSIFGTPVSKPTFADRMQAQVDAAKAETAKARAEARNRTPADIKAYYEGKLNDIKEQRDRYLADLVQAYKDRSARAKESEERGRLLRIMKRLDRLAKKSNDARRAEIKDIVGNFDLISQRISNHKAQELSELSDWVRRNKDNADAIITPQVADKLARLDKQHISDLTIGDVRAITEALLEIEHRIRTENRIIGLQERYNTVDLGKQIIQDVRNTPGTGSSAFARGMDKFLINGLMRPETEFLRLVGFNKSSPLYEYTFGDRLSLLTGQRTMQDYQREANENYFRKFLDDKSFMKSITGKNARTIEITGTDENGQQHTVKVTPDFVMAMYMHSQNVQNLMHIVNYTDEFGREVKAGGMTVPDYKLYKDGKKTEAYNAGTKLTFTRSQFMDQLKGLTDQEMEFIKAAQRYYSEMSQPRINEVSEKLLGYSLAKVDNYFRINTDPDYRGGDMENLRFDGTIEGMGWTKERVNGKNPILLVPLSEQLQKDIVSHSKYVGLAVPIRNFSKIYGITENTYAQNENGKYELQNAYASSVIKEINKKHPSGADTNYIRDLLADIQNPASNMTALDKVFAGLRSRYAGSVLTLNLGVALKQAASFPTAAAEIGWTPIIKTVPQFGKAMAGFAKPMNQQTIDFISKYSPLMRLRTQGMSTQELADMQRLNHKIPGALNWIQNVDVGTVAALWKSAEYYVKQNFKNLKPGSEEFYQKVGDVHTRIITKTQPNYSELQRPGLLRSKSEITKTLMMFKTQPFQNFNILYEAVGAYKAAERNFKANSSEENKAARDEARKRLAWAVSSQVVANGVFAAMQVAWDILRRKEDPLDEEDKSVQRLNNWFKNMISSWAGMVPGGSQALEVVQKWVDDALVAMGGEKYFDSKVYGFELDASIEGLNKMVDLITNLPNLGGDIFGLIKGDENKEEYIRDLFKQFKDVSTFFGIPTTNVMNLTQAIMEWTMTKGLGYSDAEAKYLADRYINGVDNQHPKKHYAELAIAAGEETMQMFREDSAFDTESKTAAEYLEEMQTKAAKDDFAAEYGTKEIYVEDRDSVTEEAFREFAEKYMETNDGNGNKSAKDILTALAAADLSDEEREAIYDLYGYKTPYDKAVGKVEVPAEAEVPAEVEEPVANAIETAARPAMGRATPQGMLTSEVTVGNSQAPTVSKTRSEITAPQEIRISVPEEMKEAYKMFSDSYRAKSDNDGKLSQSEAIHALNDVGEENREALYNLLADGKWTSSYHDARVSVEKDDMKQTYGTNEMYLEDSPLTGDRLDEFNRAYAAVSNNNDSVTQAELAAALNAMGASLEEGEAIWASYSQDHANKYGSGWKKTYANYYSGGGSSSGVSKSSGGSTGGGRSGGGGGRSSGGGSVQPAVGPYPGYSETPAATPTYQPVAMPEPAAAAPQTPYTGLRSHSEGGNVDLTFRPVLKAVELRRKGWGNAFSDTVRNFVKSYSKDGKALNFTPIVVDEDGKYVRTLSPNELREYAEAVLKGEREDDLKLQVGTAYEGADALAQAEKAAAEIQKLDEDYTKTA